MSKTIDAMKSAVAAMSRYQTKRHDERFLSEIDQLVWSIKQEEAQAVDPVMWMWAQVDDSGNSGQTMDKGELTQLRLDYPGIVITPLFTHPAPAAKPAKAKGDREWVISTLRDNGSRLSEVAADMLAADAQRVPMTDDELRQFRLLKGCI